MAWIKIIAANSGGVNATKDRALLMLALTDCRSIIDGIKSEKIEAAKASRPRVSRP